MSIVLFNVLPQMADITVACIYLATAMQPWAAAIVAVTVASYVPLTVIITERRGGGAAWLVHGILCGPFLPHSFHASLVLCRGGVRLRSAGHLVQLICVLCSPFVGS